MAEQWVQELVFLLFVRMVAWSDAYRERWHDMVALVVACRTLSPIELCWTYLCALLIAAVVIFEATHIMLWLRLQIWQLLSLEYGSYLTAFCAFRYCFLAMLQWMQYRVWVNSCLAIAFSLFRHNEHCLLIPFLHILPLLRINRTLDLFILCVTLWLRSCGRNHFKDWCGVILMLTFAWATFIRGVRYSVSPRQVYMDVAHCLNLEQTIHVTMVSWSICIKQNLTRFDKRALRVPQLKLWRRRYLILMNKFMNYLHLHIFIMTLWGSKHWTYTLCIFWFLAFIALVCVKVKV